MIRHPALVAAVPLALLLAAAPWPFGGVVPQAEGLLVVGALVALAAAALAAGGTSPLGRVRGPVAALAAVAAWGGLQSLPWPAAVVRRLSPEHARLAAETAAALGDPAPTAVALTLAPEVTRSTALLFAALAAVTATGAYAAASALGRRLVAGTVLIVALAQILADLPRWLAGGRTIWGVDVATDATRLRGTFVNPNHLATFLLIALALAFAWIWWAARKSAGGSAERRLAWLAPPVGTWLLLFTGLAFTGSRSGLLAAVAGTGVVALAAGRSSRRRRARRRAALAAGAVLAAGVAMVAWLSFDAGFRRVLELRGRYDGGWGGRRAAWDAALELLPRFPLGTGLGTFRDAFPLVEPPGEEVWWHLHQGPLELLVTGGLPALLALGLGTGLVLLHLWRRMGPGHRTEGRGLALAALGAVAAIGVQELVDFGLTMPANSFALAAIIGLALAASLPPPARRRRARRGRRATETTTGGSGSSAGPATPGRRLPGWRGPAGGDRPAPPSRA